MSSHTLVRQETVEEARRLLAQQPLFLDTETTGLGERAEVIEIAILDHDGAVLLETFVRPRLPIPREVIRIHGITDQIVRNAPVWAELWPQVQVILQGRIVGIYNAEFDRRMLVQSHKGAQLLWQEDGLSSFCIMQLYARFYGVRHHSSFRWQSLANAGRQCRLPLVNSHRAADDARLARAVLHFIAKS
jgi:DNA polymerase III subunit epsilon